MDAKVRDNSAVCLNCRSAPPLEALEDGCRTATNSFNSSVHNDDALKSLRASKQREWFKTERQMLWHLRLEAELFKREWIWLVLAIVAEYFHMLSHNLVFYLEGQIWGQEGPPPALKDLGLMLLANRLPENSKWLVTFGTAFLVALLLLMGLGRVVLEIEWGGPHMRLMGKDQSNQRGVLIPVPVVLIIKRACQALCIALVLRCTTFLVTLLPNPSSYCHGTEWNPPKTVYEVLTRLAFTGGCGDLMFSGHTTHGVILTATILRYAPALRPAIGMAIATMTLLALSLLAFKDHYTSDVLVAIYVTSMIWMLLPPESATLDAYDLKAENLLEYHSEGPITDEHTSSSSSSSSSNWEDAAARDIIAVEEGQGGGGGRSYLPSAQESAAYLSPSASSPLGMSPATSLSPPSFSLGCSPLQGPSPTTSPETYSRASVS